MNRRAPLQQRANADHDIETKGAVPEVFIAQQHANMARLRGERELAVAATNIQTEYRRRLEETRELALRLERQLVSVRKELALSQSARKDLMAVLARVQAPLQLTLDWTNARAKGRPQTASGEVVSRALQQSNHDLKKAVETLTSELMLLDTAIGRLQKSEASFVEELRSKAATMVLDRACLEDEVAMSGGAPVSQSKFAPQPPNGNSPSSDGGSSARPKALMQSHAMHTENEWRNQTYASLSNGVAAIEASLHARKSVSFALKGLEDSGRLKRPMCVVDALQTHMKYESQQINQLKYNQRMVQGEMATLEKHTATVQGTLNRVRQQLSTADHRLGLQVVRPESEATRTGVEEVLEVELVNMQRTEQTLLVQLAELAKKRERLVQLKKKIETELHQRMDSHQLDSTCVTMQMSSLPQIADRYKHTLPGASPRGGRRDQATTEPGSGRNPRSMSQLLAEQSPRSARVKAPDQASPRSGRKAAKPHSGPAHSRHAAYA